MTMTREDYLNILHSHDDPIEWECPSDFDYEDAERRVTLLVKCIEQAIGLPCGIMTGSQIQDASFHTTISLPTKEVSHWPIYLLKISNFGNLAAIGDEKALEPAHLQKVLSCLSELGYQYIPPEVLSEKYDGAIPELRGVNWYTRYFEWL